MSIKTFTLILPAFWASALINGDYSGLTDDEITDMENCLYVNETCAGSCLTCEEYGITRYHDASRYVGIVDCEIYTFRI